MRLLKALLVSLFVMGAAPAFAQNAGAPPDTGSAVQAVPDPGADVGSFIKSAYDAAQRGDYRMFAALALIGVVYVSRKYGAKVPGKVGAFVASDRGGAVLALGLAIIGGITHALLAAQPLGLSMLATAVYISFLAAGGYSLVKKAGMEDLMKKLLAKMGLVLVLCAAVGSSGCAWLQAHPQVAKAGGCAITAIEQAAPSLIGDVTTALSGGSPDWGQLLTLEEAHGPDTIMCLVQSFLSGSKGAADPKLHAAALQYVAEGGSWRHFGHAMRLMRELQRQPDPAPAPGVSL